MWTASTTSKAPARTGNAADISIEQRRVNGRPQHPHRPITPGRVHWPLSQRAQVLTVATASIQHPQPRREPGQIQNPGHDVKVRILVPPQALAGTQVPVIGILWPGGFNATTTPCPLPEAAGSDQARPGWAGVSAMMCVPTLRA